MPASENYCFAPITVADTRTPAQRRRIMQSVGTKDTAPELTVRRLLFGEGFRYRLHVKDLPGKPDIVFPSKKKAIFVHGCFWHGHHCPKGRPPQSRPEYWGPKLAQNIRRDQKNIEDLQTLGWDALVVWQCQTRDLTALGCRLKNFLANEQ